jgi:small subunit ribosomal protein S16
MIRIRLKRYGRKHFPSYRIVVMEQKTKRDGRAIEELGFYNSLTKETKLNIPRILNWLSYGAQPTETVRNILFRAKLVED